jgi:FKBP-type peptidyl-prolyl cis-trans isomerase 2
MNKIKKGDFVEIDYTGKLKEGNIIFDTTDEKIAKYNNIYQENYDYKPRIICVGEGHIIHGIDSQLDNKEIQKEYTFNLKPEQAFGKKNVKLLRLMPSSIFKKQNINPIPGLQVVIDDMLGVIKTVTGGRAIVDFNHPLSGKELVYVVKINKIVTNEIEKIRSYIENQVGIKVEVKKENDKIKVILKNDLPDELKKELTRKIKELIKVNNLEFVNKEKGN